MRQILQNLRDGRVEIADTPVPAVTRGHLLIRSSLSVVSAGTERMLIDFGRAGPISKLRQQPEKARAVIAKARTDGLIATVEAVRAKLDQPIALGYSNVGRVLAVGEGVTGWRVGERVASNGSHAEIVRVPVNLSARVPDQVSDDAASFTVVASIAMHGVRLATPTVGETFVVIGLGIIGLLTVQILHANGCRVLGIDLDQRRVDLARGFGAVGVQAGAGSDPLELAAAMTDGRGVDGVILAAATSSDEPLAQAARMCRKRGRIVLVGTAGLTISRADFYEKELTFQVSCSYGPGRYDPNYEELGHDYPVGYVRWTEQRNFEAVLELMRAGRLDVAPLISHRFAIDGAEDAYAALAAGSALGILLEYPQAPATEDLSSQRCMPVSTRPVATRADTLAVAFAGAGNYASRILMPAFAAAGADMHTVITTGSVQGLHAARKRGFRKVGTDLQATLADASIDALVIATRHDTHADLAVMALEAGKHVFVEKPLALHTSDVDRIERALRSSGKVLTVGFNRRRARDVLRLHAMLAARSEPKSFIYTINAGRLPPGHWIQQEAQGGRIVGECCHFIDLLRHLANAPIAMTKIVAMRRSAASSPPDTVSLSLAFQGGSIGTIHYFSNGASGYPKERLEVFCGGSVAVLENYRTLRTFDWPGARNSSSLRQDKGQIAFATAFMAAASGERPPPIAYDEVFEVARVTLRVAAEAEAIV